MASGVPVVTSRIAPFIEYLGDDDVLWCDPLDTASIATAMAASLDPSRRETLIARGIRIAARHDWMTTAQSHLAAYEILGQLARIETATSAFTDDPAACVAVDTLQQ